MRLDNFTIAVLVTIVPFVLFLIYGFWSGKIRSDNEPMQGYHRDADDAVERPG